jgi:hypothetical protein
MHQRAESLFALFETQNILLPLSSIILNCHRNVIIVLSVCDLLSLCFFKKKDLPLRDQCLFSDYMNYKYPE